MSEQELIELVDRLRSETSEKEWLEFKETRVQPNERLGEYLSALANSAALAYQPYGYLILGIHDKTHAITGTSFDYRTEKAKKNQGLLRWTESGLNPSTPVVPFEFTHPDGGRVVLFRIEAATQGQPVSFYNKTLVRVDSDNQPLSKYPDRERRLWNLAVDWSAEIVPKATLDHLDPEAIAKAREQFAAKYPTKASELERWDDATFLNKARVTLNGEITNAAILLLGRDEAAPLISPAVAELSWLLRDAKNMPIGSEHYSTPFILTVDRLLENVRSLTIRAMPGGTLFPKLISQYDKDFVLREAVHNAIAHQDYRQGGRITFGEFPDRLLITNVGRFIPGSVEAVIEQDAPQRIYRNPFLVKAMERLNMIETEGGGIKKMHETQRERYLPMPSYEFTDEPSVRVIIPGAILDEHYTRLLINRPDLTLGQVYLLDKVQKGVEIPHEEHKRLREEGLVEGRWPRTLISGQIAQATGREAELVRTTGLDNEFYQALVLKLIGDHGPVTRGQIDHLLVKKLPEDLTPKQKRARVSNLLTALRKEGKIRNDGSRRKPAWTLDQGESP